MDSFLSFIRDISDRTLFIWILIAIIYDFYWYARIRKILGKNFKKTPTVKNKKIISRIFDVIIIAFIIIGLLVFIQFSNPYLFINSVLIYLWKIYFSQFIGNLINYNDKGLTYKNLNGFNLVEPVKWQDVKNIYWDNDLGQKNFGFNLNLKNVEKPIKLWTLRKNREKINEVFNKYNVPIKNTN